MAFSNQEKKLQSFSIRNALICIHKDLFRIHRRILSYSDSCPEELTNLEKMILVLEDRRFFDHVGVDTISSVREVMRALTFQRHGGASTIDMQFVRTATGYKSRKISRKLYEIFLAIIMQYRYTKIVILRSYISCAFFGSHLVGASRASNAIWGKDPEVLDLDQAAFLAAMLVYPRPKSDNSIWEARVQRRANYGMAVYRANKKRFEKLPG